MEDRLGTPGADGMGSDTNGARWFPLTGAREVPWFMAKTISQELYHKVAYIRSVQLKEPICLHLSRPKFRFDLFKWKK